ncbi:hypothetical protein NC653_027454 [Populus alba x Populus x berolinensis]|uniref:Uncharacterized protein n=1 Tax=Populus alba x Populus x berolinensis TaxID=444605 RepID=A0AAD6M5D6_9ROSI|nr:hypothetical protein NC653_027454 [Populus alba x Populus x berolinensis]
MLFFSDIIGIPLPCLMDPFGFRQRMNHASGFHKVLKDVRVITTGPIFDIPSQIKSATLELNTDVFGNIFCRKKKVLALIAGTQCSIAAFNS